MSHENHWNWQQADWPSFRFDRAKLDRLEADFLRQSGVLAGTIKHISADDKNAFTVNMISTEALETSEIEGEILNRESLQSSIRHQFGLATDHRKIPAAEQGISEMMSDLYHRFAEPLSHDSLQRWHRMLMNGRQDLENLGAYRTHEAPMQVVSGRLDRPTVHFEAPPSPAMAREMEQFVAWFARTAPHGPESLPALTRAGMAHLYFVSIHPYEDGNGRIGRAISEKALSQSLGQPTLIALSKTINRQRKQYYDILEASNKRNEITDWLVYFAQTILEALSLSQSLLELVIAKARFFDRYRGQLNARQEKVIVRMFQEEPEGFKGGLSAGNYVSIAGTSAATATRDLQDLVEKKALYQTGTHRSTRYHLALAAGE